MAEEEQEIEQTKDTNVANVEMAQIGANKEIEINKEDNITARHESDNELKGKENDNETTVKVEEIKNETDRLKTTEETKRYELLLDYQREKNRENLMNYFALIVGQSNIRELSRMRVLLKEKKRYIEDLIQKTNNTKQGTEKDYYKEEGRVEVWRENLLYMEANIKTLKEHNIDFKPKEERAEKIKINIRNSAEKMLGYMGSINSLNDSLKELESELYEKELELKMLEFELNDQTLGMGAVGELIGQVQQNIPKESLYQIESSNIKQLSY